MENGGTEKKLQLGKSKLYFTRNCIVGLDKKCYIWINMIDSNEIEEVIESFGLVKESKVDFIYGGFGEFCALIYFKENGKACVFEYNSGFSKNLNNKRAVIWKMKKLFKDMKEDKLRIKLERMNGDFV